MPVKTDGDWNILSKVWMSLLMVPGSFVTRPDGPVMLVVSATPFGFIGYRCSYKKQNNDVVVDLQAISEDPFDLRLR